MTKTMVAPDALKATQDNQLIEACYSMTLNEKRLLLFGISKINPSVFPDASKPFSFEMNGQNNLVAIILGNPYKGQLISCLVDT